MRNQGRWMTSPIPFSIEIEVSRGSNNQAWHLMPLALNLGVTLMGSYISQCYLGRKCGHTQARPSLTGASVASSHPSLVQAALQEKEHWGYLRISSWALDSPVTKDTANSQDNGSLCQSFIAKLYCWTENPAKVSPLPGRPRFKVKHCILKSNYT